MESEASGARSGVVLGLRARDSVSDCGCTKCGWAISRIPHGNYRVGVDADVTAVWLVERRHFGREICVAPWELVAAARTHPDE